jgi:hypothetical protein
LAQQPALSCSIFPLPRWWHRVPQVSSLPAYQNAAGKVWTDTERNLCMHAWDSSLAKTITLTSG